MLGASHFNLLYKELWRYSFRSLRLCKLGSVKFSGKRNTKDPPDAKLSVITTIILIQGQHRVPHFPAEAIRPVFDIFDAVFTIMGRWQKSSRTLEFRGVKFRPYYLGKHACHCMVPVEKMR